MQYMILADLGSLDDTVVEVKAEANKATCDAQRAYEFAMSHPGDLDALAKADAMRDIANELWREQDLIPA